MIPKSPPAGDHASPPRLYITPVARGGGGWIVPNALVTGRHLEINESDIIKGSWSNQRSGVDAGWRVEFAFLAQWRASAEFLR